MVALALSASSMMLTARSPPDLVQHFVHVQVRRLGTLAGAVSAATVRDVGDGQTNRICRRPTLRAPAGPGSASPATAPDGRPGGSAHHRTEPDRLEQFADDSRNAPAFGGAPFEVGAGRLGVG